jgi:hypothetical protein
MKNRECWDLGKLYQPAPIWFTMRRVSSSRIKTGVFYIAEESPLYHAER